MTTISPNEACYLCGDVPISKEHVPARCFFPSDAEYRKQLITVSSCKKHNEDTSADDEYVRNIITTHHGNNHVAFQHFRDKVVRSLQRNPGLMGERRVVDTDQGKTYAFNIDRNRFDRTIRKIAYAIFFHEYHFQWNRELIVLTEHLVYEDLTKDDFGIFLEKAKINLPPDLDRGDNPKVFKYRVLTSSDSTQNTLLQMTFYEGFTVWITTFEGSITYKL